MLHLPSAVFQEALSDTMLSRFVYDLAGKQINVITTRYKRLPTHKDGVCQAVYPEKGAFNTFILKLKWRAGRRIIRLRFVPETTYIGWIDGRIDSPLNSGRRKVEVIDA